jgi:hypothetical protein
METNRTAGVRFRKEVLAYLRQSGVDAEDPFESNRTLSQRIGDRSVFTDISGVGPWVIDVRSTKTFDLSNALIDSELAAKAAGSDWFVSIQNRRGNPVEESYCLLPLRLMNRIFKGEIPSMPTSP